MESSDVAMPPGPIINLAAKPIIDNATESATVTLEEDESSSDTESEDESHAQGNSGMSEKRKLENAIFAQ